MLDDKKLQRFLLIAEKILSKVQMYWDQQRKPLHSKYCIIPHLARMPDGERIEFSEWLARQPSFVIRLANTTGSTYVFPDPDRNKIDIPMIDQKMHELDLIRRTSKTKAYRERKARDSEKESQK